MHRRKSTRLIAQAAVAEAASSTAAREVYKCADVRREILRLLAWPDLARCMRVSKEGMEDIAGILYKSRTWEQMRRYRKSEETRHKIYRASVIELLQPPRMSLIEMRKSLESDSILPAGAEGELYTRFVLPLRERFPNMRQLRIPAQNAPPRTEAWVIRLEPARCDYGGSPMPDSPTPIPPLHVEIVEDRFHDLDDEPPKLVESPYPPSQVNIIHHRFNLDLDYEGFSMRPHFTDEWLKFIRESPSMSQICRVLGASQVPVTMDDLVSIYNRQAACGHAERLSSVYALDAAPYTIDDLGHLAKVASSYLTTLYLGEGDTTFSNLPALVRMITRDLVNLDSLSIHMGGIETAEEICGQLLQQDTLDKEGSVSSLRINTAAVHGPLFNTIRCLSVICRGKATMAIGDEGGRGQWTVAVQTELLEYLRSQPPAARAHLSTIDFPAALDITTPAQVMDLQYHDDGRPRPRRQVQAESWLGLSQALNSYAVDTMIPTLTNTMESLLASSKRFKRAANSQSTDSILEEAGELLQKVKQAMDAADLGRTILHHAVGMRDEIEEFVNMVKDINGIDRDLGVEDE